MSERVGWIGTGVMGAPMARHLLDGGYQVEVFNRTRARAEELVQAGARWREGPRELAADADVICLMLGFPDDVRTILLGDGGVLQAMKPGSLLIDFTTSVPTLAAEIDEAARARDVEALDAPVSGGDVGARNASLVIMVGGSEAAFGRAQPLFSKLGRTVTRLGEAGSGQHTKMMNQVAIASGMIGLCEALLYAHRAGLDVEQAIETIKGGAAGSWSLSNYAPRVLRGDLEPGFKIDHFIKDLGIALSEARRMNLSLPGTALAEQLYVAARSQGLGQKGTHALAVALAQLSNERWPAR
ncbi:MAG: NAD(P)-dependent oxidoreductase [Solirubrobacterales bacterium]|nr:NAD(P)-dependent oxidoreductase [Solirubrobacterales bacterium]MBV9917352.1 NAD(P)-dependent oxidoreductase [Solirubrobacterales bacterium]